MDFGHTHPLTVRVGNHEITVGRLTLPGEGEPAVVLAPEGVRQLRDLLGLTDDTT